MSDEKVQCMTRNMCWKRDVLLEVKGLEQRLEAGVVRRARVINMKVEITRNENFGRCTSKIYEQ